MDEGDPRVVDEEVVDCPFHRLLAVPILVYGHCSCHGHDGLIQLRRRIEWRELHFPINFLSDAYQTKREIREIGDNGDRKRRGREREEMRSLSFSSCSSFLPFSFFLLSVFFFRFLLSFFFLKIFEEVKRQS